MHNYKKLEVWQRSMDLCVKVYGICRQLPSEEKFGMYSQLTRSSVSISANIAEGCGRQHPKEFKQFLSIALGSCYETETHLILLHRVGFLKQGDIFSDLETLQRMLRGLIRNL